MKRGLIGLSAIIGLGCYGDNMNEGRAYSDAESRNESAQEEGMPLFQLACAGWSGTCHDFMQNQNEKGIDCGGICPPCNTVCNTPVRYAPADTPCTGHYIPMKDDYSCSNEALSDQHRVELTWTDSGLECNCQYIEVCDEGLDFIIEEALQCCSSRNQEEVDAFSLNGTSYGALCREAVEGAKGNCKACTALYVIKGLGPYKRWMQGYHRDDTMNYTICGTKCGASPSEMLINMHHTGICRDYAPVVTTILRKLGYSQMDVSNYCDGRHCYNLVRMPDNEKWHVVDTTGNAAGIIINQLPTTYNYCRKLNETRLCFNGIRTYPDVDAYRASIEMGLAPPTTPCNGFEEEYLEFLPMCGPGLSCFSDNARIPDFAPSVWDIIGCENEPEY
ncbi:MAG: hypothetical protein V1734_04660 [Nanoarchaeota archaeon]